MKVVAPGEWPRAKLGYLVRELGGSTPSKDREDFWGGDVPWVSPKDMKVDLISDSMDHITEAALAGSSLRPVPIGSVLMVVRGMILAHSVPVALTDAPVTVNQDMKALVPGPRVSGLYLRYCLQAHRDLLLALVEEAGHGTRCLRSEQWRKFEMSLAPLPTQKAIAAFLDRKTAAIDALIEKKQKLLDLLAEKRAALINKAVTKGLDPNVPMKDSGIPWIGKIPAHWETPQLGHCLTRITYGFTCPMPTTDDGPYMLTANDIRDGFVDYENARRTDACAAARLTEKCLPQAGDILLTKDGTLGRIAVADGSAACINQSVALLRTNARLSFLFLSWMLRSSSYQDWMVFDAGGTTIKHIYITRIVKMTALIPPLAEQAAIVGEVGRLDELMQGALRGTAASLERLKEYRQALITAAVTGQLDISEETA